MLKLRTRRLGGLLMVVLLLAGAGVMAHRPARADHGAVIEADDFDDPARGVFPRSSSDANVRLGYVSGEYQIAVVNANWNNLAWVVSNNTQTDVAIAVSARFVDAFEKRYVALGCRESGAGQYRLVLDPTAGRIRLERWGPSGPTDIANTFSPAVRQGLASNRIELECRGATITAIVNGVTVVSVNDSALTSGRTFIGAGRWNDGPPLPVDARFDRYVLTRPGTAPVAPQPVIPPTAQADSVTILSASPAPGTVIAGGGPAEFVVRVRYTLASRPRASLSMFVEQYPDQPRRCSGDVHNTNGGTATGVQRGQGEVTLTVPWRGRDGSGWLSLGARYFGEDGYSASEAFYADAYCYRFETLAPLRPAVALTGWRWANLSELWISPGCPAFPLTPRTSAAGVRATKAWNAALDQLGVMVWPNEQACWAIQPAIVMREADVPLNPAPVYARAFREDESVCAPDEDCLIFTGLVVFNTAWLGDVGDEDLAWLAMRAVGQLLGLGEAAACTGNSIMHPSPTCRRATPGPDDIQALGERIHGER